MNQPFQRAITQAEAFHALAASDLARINPAVTYTCRMLLFQLFRQPASAGEFADQELARVYGGEPPAGETMEVEVALSTSDFTRGPTEDTTPADYSVSSPCSSIYSHDKIRRTVALKCVE